MRWLHPFLSSFGPLFEVRGSPSPPTPQVCSMLKGVGGHRWSFHFWTFLSQRRWQQWQQVDRYIQGRQLTWSRERRIRPVLLAWTSVSALGGLGGSHLFLHLCQSSLFMGQSALLKGGILQGLWDCHCYSSQPGDKAEINNSSLLPTEMAVQTALKDFIAGVTAGVNYCCLRRREHTLTTVY